LERPGPGINSRASFVASCVPPREDARAFEATLALVRRYHLRGYSVWLLGLEDAATWEIIGRVTK
jgi:hypothetical protein